MGILNDLFNTLLADSVSKEAGDAYFAYTLMRDDAEERRKKERFQDEMRKLDREHQEKMAELKHCEFELMREENAIRAALKAEGYTDAKQKLAEAERKLDQLRYQWMGCESLEELCDKLDTDEKWEKFVEVMPEYARFNERRAKLMAERASKAASDEDGQ